MPCVYGKRTFGEAFDESFDLGQFRLDFEWDGFMGVPTNDDYVPGPTATLLSFDASSEVLAPFMSINGPSSENMQLINHENEGIREDQENGQTLSKFDYAPMADICVSRSTTQPYRNNADERISKTLSHGKSTTQIPKLTISSKL